jgi:predicted TIM-barrel fold metal-dependent hydrolase
MRDGIKVMDCDRHVLEPWDIWDKYVDAPFKHYIGSIVQRPRVGGRRLDRPDDVQRFDVFDGDPYWRGTFKNAIRCFFNNESYLEDMNREGVDIGVLFSSAGLSFCWYDDLDPELSLALCRAYNNWLYDYCSIAPERMLGVALLPLQDVKLAERELRRAVCELGLAGIFWRPNAHFGRRVSDRIYEPVLALAQELGVPVGFHEGATGTASPSRGGSPDGFGFRWFGSGRTDTRYAAHAARHPMEQMGAFIAVASDGVLDRFPHLRVAFLEAGCGWLPYWLERLDVLYDNPVFRESYQGAERPSEYFHRGQCFVSCEAEEEGIPLLGRLLGEDCLMWASDYPHPDSVRHFPNTMAGVLENHELSAAFKRKILWDNPARFYNLEARQGSEA